MWDEQWRKTDLDGLAIRQLLMVGMAVKSQKFVVFVTFVLFLFCDIAILRAYQKSKQFL